MEKQKYEFGVMSSRYKLKSKHLRTAKLAMTLYLHTAAPIVIYSPIRIAFNPVEILKEEIVQNKPVPDDLKEVIASIEKII